MQSDGEFFNTEIKNPEFHATSQSLFLSHHDSLINQSNELFSFLKYKIDHSNLNDLLTIEETLLSYEKSFNNLKDLVLVRGFLDYGLEGKMRFFAHEIEERYNSQIASEDLLMLRRHEKDYLLRGDDIYVNKLNKLASSITESFGNSERNNEPLNLLLNYKNTFNELVQTVNRMGKASNEGLYGELFDIKKNYQEQLNTFESTLLDKTQAEISRLTLIYNVVLGGIIIMCSFFVTYIGYKLVNPVNYLSQIMETIKTNSFSKMQIDKPNTRISEINNLFDSFKHLLERIQYQIDEIEEKSQLLEHQNFDLKKLNEELDRFLYSSAHDLKSPLSSILGLVDITRRESNDQKIILYLDMMEKSVRKLEDYIKDIVSYAKNKNQELTITEIDLENQLNSVFEEFEFIEGAGRIDKKVLYKEEFPHCYTDVSRLKIILFNLLSNSFRYFDPEKPNSYIHIYGMVKENKTKISIKDNGIGIDDKYKSDVFKMFFRANENSKGSGLGLYIVKETIKKMKGSIELETELGIGTTFHVIIPNEVKIGYKEGNGAAVLEVTETI